MTYFCYDFYLNFLRKSSQKSINVSFISEFNLSGGSRNSNQFNVGFVYLIKFIHYFSEFHLRLLPYSSLSRTKRAFQLPSRPFPISMLFTPVLNKKILTGLYELSSSNLMFSSAGPIPLASYLIIVPVGSIQPSIHKKLHLYTSLVKAWAGFVNTTDQKGNTEGSGLSGN